MILFFSSSCSSNAVIDVFVSDYLFRSRANINGAGDMGQESGSTLRSICRRSLALASMSSFYLARPFALPVSSFILPSRLTLLARGRTSREAGGGETSSNRRPAADKDTASFIPSSLLA